MLGAWDAAPLRARVQTREGSPRAGRHLPPLLLAADLNLNLRTGAERRLWGSGSIPATLQCRLEAEQQ